MSYRSLFAFLVIFLCRLGSFAQLSESDSLRLKIKGSEGTKRITYLLELADLSFSHHDYKETDSTLSVAEKLAAESNDQRSLAAVYVRQGNNLEHKKSEIALCGSMHEKGLRILRELNDSLALADLYCLAGDHYYSYHANGNMRLRCYLNAFNYCSNLDTKTGRRILMTLVLIYKLSGNFPKAVEYNNMVIGMYEKLTDYRGLSACYRNQSELFYDQEKVDIALEYAKKAYEASQKMPEKARRSNTQCYTLFTVARAYMGTGDFKSAHRFAEEGIRISQEIGDKWAETDAWNVYGMVCTFEGKLQDARRCYLQAYEAKRSVNDTMPGLTYVYGNLADLSLQMKDYRSAIFYARRTVEMAEMLQDKGQVHGMYRILAKAYEKENDYRSAYTYHVKYKQLADSLFNAENVAVIEGLRLEAEFSKKEAVRKEQDVKTQMMAEQERKKQRLITYSILAGLAIVMLFAGFVLRSLRIARRQKQIIEIKSLETEKQKQIIEARNKDITDSINYAQRIQQATLPDKGEIYKSLPDAFVLYKPKDIVSGDFYFFHRTEKLIFIAAADCTGHGVPGAFMSMISYKQLQDAVMQSNDPSEILRLVNKGIRASLRQSGNDESTRDGMDIVLCAIDPATLSVSYSGANRPLWIIRKGSEALLEIRATKKAIGGLTPDDQVFETHQLQLEKGDRLYLTTDGYADTFSGSNSKKLTTKKFKALLMSMQALNMREQEAKLDSFIESWKEGTEQVDDILVIGISI